MEINFSNQERFPEYFNDMNKRLDEFERKIMSLERERNINSNEILAKCKKNNEILDRLSTKLNEVDKTIKSKIPKIERIANSTEQTLVELIKKIEEMQQILKPKESIKETIVIGSLINNNKSSIDDGNKDYYFVCPNCQCRNPHIVNVNIDIEQRDFNVSYYCACNMLNKRLRASCLSSLINENIPYNFCPTHSNKTLKFFCKECKNSFCELCEKDNDGHQQYLVNYTKMMSDEDAELMETILEKFECKNKNIYKKIIGNYFKQYKKKDVEKYHLKKKIKDINKDITSLILLQSGMIAIGSNDSTIGIWDLENSLCVKTIHDWANVLSLLEFEPNKLISISSQNTILLWDINSNENDISDFICSFNTNFLLVNYLVKCDDNTFATKSEEDSSITIWDYHGRKPIIELPDKNVLSLIKLSDGNLCAGSEDKLIKIWDWKKKNQIKVLKGHNNWVNCLCQINDKILLSGSYDKMIKVWKNYECIKTIENNECVSVLLKLNNDYFAQNSNNKIKIWNMRNFLCCDILNGHSLDITGLIKANNNEIISCSKDNTIIIWEKN